MAGMIPWQRLISSSPVLLQLLTFPETWELFLTHHSIITEDLVDYLYEAIVKIYTNQTDDEGGGVPEETVEAEDRILDFNTLTNLVNSIDIPATFNTLTGIFNFITANFDVVTALALVRHLENRASYDPR